MNSFCSFVIVTTLFWSSTMKQKKPPRSNTFKTDLISSSKFIWHSSYIPINKKSKCHAYNQTGYEKVTLRYNVLEGKNPKSTCMDTKFSVGYYSPPKNRIQAFLKFILKQDILKTIILVLYYLLKIYLDITISN
jgi:hypothetical protein